jgi:hypothetical protein
MIPKKQRFLNKESFFFPILEVPLILTQGEESITFSKVLLKREDNVPLKKRILSVVSPDYFIVMHEDFLNVVENYLKKQGLFAEIYDINTGGKNGNMLFVNYILSFYKFNFLGDSWVPFIQAYNCYDKFMSYGLGVGIYNLDIESSILFATNIVTSKKRHVRKKEIVLDDDIKKVATWISSISDTVKTLLKLEKIEIPNKDHAVSVIQKILGNRRHFKIYMKEELLDSFSLKYGFNYYGLLLSLMYYVNHAPFVFLYKRKYDFSREFQLKLYNTFIKKEIL